ncbi:hypothetical protein ACWD11_22620 [Streptomyces sp. NPDC002776]
MSENVNPLAAIEAMEAAAFRTGSMARRLLADHPDIPIEKIRPGPVSGGTAELHITTGDSDGARLMAERLGLSVEVTISSHTFSTGYESVYGACEAAGPVDDVSIHLLGVRNMDDAEREAWIAERDQAAAARAELAPGGEGR